MGKKGNRKVGESRDDDDGRGSGGADGGPDVNSHFNLRLKSSLT